MLFRSDNHDLLPLGQLASYKGLVFGSLNADVAPLQEHLGGLRPVIDLALDQGEHGMEFVPGRISLIYHGNWKMQMDNGIDPYHLTSTHAGFMDVMGRRRDGEGNQAARQFDWQKRLSQQGGAFLFKNGHSAIWLNDRIVIAGGFDVQGLANVEYYNPATGTFSPAGALSMARGNLGASIAGGKALFSGGSNAFALTNADL